MIDKGVVRDRLGSFVELFQRECGEYALRRSGTHFSTQCPFHEERSPSFHVYEDHGHCFGCGWHGDHFAFLQETRGLGFKDALQLAASFVGIFPAGSDELSAQRSASGSEKMQPVSRVRPVLKRANTLEERGKVRFLEGTRRLTGEEIGTLAKLRGLSRKAVEIAAADSRVGFAEWPKGGQHASWVVSDSEKWVAQYRRLDGESYKLKSAAGTGNLSANRTGGGAAASIGADDNDNDEVNERLIKAWTNGTPTWPLGCAEIGNRAAVMLVEGGADMLAAYHFLWEVGRRLYRPGRPDRWLLDKVAVVCVLGASNRLCAESLEFFKGKRVRIFIDADKAKAKPLRRCPDEGLAKHLESGGEWGFPYNRRVVADVLGRDLSEKESEWLDARDLLEAQRAEVAAEPFDLVTGLPNQPEGWKVPSIEAACRWGEQLRDAGAVVTTFQLYGIEMKAAEAGEERGQREDDEGDADRTDGGVSLVGDLNDLALCDEEIWMAPEILEGFVKWDF
jgi:hypothetical protein